MKTSALEFKATMGQFATEVQAQLREGDRFALQYNGAEELPWMAEVYAGKSGRHCHRGKTAEKAMGGLLRDVAMAAPSRLPSPIRPGTSADFAGRIRKAGG